MASQIVQILKKSRELSIYQANSNLRIPGFKQLEGCKTTVDMDVDPEVFVMLEPIQIMGKKVTPTNGRDCSARRLRSIFTTTTSFFQWRLPNGEKMLRESGIENIPGQIFDEIKTTLVQSDPHFSRFSPMAIKRCLMLFTENILPMPARADPVNGNGKTARDFAREA